MRVLLAEDDDALSMFLKRALESDGNVRERVKDGATAILSATACPPDLLLLDLNLPDKSGVDVLTELQQVNPSIPTLVLSGRTSVQDRVACLDLGADDYLQKPFSLGELLARCRAVRRRHATSAPALICHEDLELDRLSRTVRRANIAVELTTKEHAMLDYFLQHRGRVLGREELLTKVFNLSAETQTNVVEVYVSYLRTKLKVTPHSSALIDTIRGQGYTIRLQRFSDLNRPA